MKKQLKDLCYSFDWDTVSRSKHNGCPRLVITSVCLGTAKAYKKYIRNFMPKIDNCIILAHLFVKERLNYTPVSTINMYLLK